MGAGVLLKGGVLGVTANQSPYFPNTMADDHTLNKIFTAKDFNIYDLFSIENEQRAENSNVKPQLIDLGLSDNFDLEPSFTIPDEWPDDATTVYQNAPANDVYFDLSTDLPDTNEQPFSEENEGPSINPADSVEQPQEFDADTSNGILEIPTFVTEQVPLSILLNDDMPELGTEQMSGAPDQGPRDEKGTEQKNDAPAPELSQPEIKADPDDAFEELVHDELLDATKEHAIERDKVINAEDGRISRDEAELLTTNMSPDSGPSTTTDGIHSVGEETGTDAERGHESSDNDIVTNTLKKGAEKPTDSAKPTQDDPNKKDNPKNQKPQSGGAGKDFSFGFIPDTIKASTDTISRGIKGIGKGVRAANNLMRSKGGAGSPPELTSKDLDKSILKSHASGVTDALRFIDKNLDKYKNTESAETKVLLSQQNAEAMEVIKQGAEAIGDEKFSNALSDNLDKLKDKAEECGDEKTADKLQDLIKQISAFIKALFAPQKDKEPAPAP